jgi:uncharacterized SAM-binding protein YcdF (DUF218 family)
MIDAVVGILKENFRIGAPLPIVAALAFGVALLYGRRTAAWGRRWLTLVVFGYWMLATPFGSWLVSWPLSHGHHRIETREEANGAQAIVILGGGIETHAVGPLAIDDLNGSALRMIEGVRLYQLLGGVPLIVSGGNSAQRDPPRPEAAAFRTAVINLGVPPAHVIVEDQGLTTREEAIAIKRMLDERRIDRFVLVTSPDHMSRSLAAFGAVGLHPVPSASAVRGEPGYPLWTLTPDRESLSISDIAFYEYAAWLLYWWRGWLKAP